MNIGDRVKFITEDDCFVPFGSTGFVIDFPRPNSVKVRFENLTEGNQEWTCSATELEVIRMPFEVGQRVRVIGGRLSTATSGGTGTVREREEYEDIPWDYYVEFDDSFEDEWGDTCEGYWIDEHNLEAIELDPNRPPVVGDRVVGVGLMDDYYDIDGQLGTIMNVDSLSNHIGIAFDNWHDGHNLEGRCTNNGLWVDRNHWMYADVQVQTKKAKRKTSGRKTGFGKFAAKLDKAVDNVPF